MQVEFVCKCGGLIVLDTEAKTSAHSLPACETYLLVCRAGNAKCEGLKMRDPRTRELKPLPKAD